MADPEAAGWKCDGLLGIEALKHRIIESLKRSARVACIAGALGGAVVVAPSVLGQQQPDRKAIVAQQKKQMEAAFAAMPKLAQKRIQDIFSLRMENKSLVCHTPLLEGDQIRQGQMHAEVEGLGDLTSVQVTKIIFGGPRGPQEMKSFVLTTYDYSDPETIQTISVQSQAFYFVIERQYQLPDGYRSIRLTQQGQNVGPARAGQCQLTVVQTTNGGQLPVNVTLEAADFYTLLRRYPKEADQYLRPVLRQIDQESVFAPDPLIAWQVFSDRWTPDDKVGRQIDGLLPKLDATDFRVRDQALKELESLGRAGAAVLLHLDRAKLSPEQNMRVDRALGPFTQLATRELGRLRNDPSFLLDCLYGEDSAVRSAALDRLREVSGKKSIKFDLDANARQRADQVTALRRELTGTAKS